MSFSLLLLQLNISSSPPTPLPPFTICVRRRLRLLERSSASSQINRNLFRRRPCCISYGIRPCTFPELHHDGRRIATLTDWQPPLIEIHRRLSCIARSRLSEHKRKDVICHNKSLPGIHAFSLLDPLKYSYGKKVLLNNCCLFSLQTMLTISEPLVGHYSNRDLLAIQSGIFQRFLSVPTRTM